MSDRHQLAKEAKRGALGRAAKKLMLIGALIAGGSTLGGAVAAAKERAKEPTAPPNQIPPGY